MRRKNLFDGESYKAEFAIITYRWLISRRWVTYADIMADRLGYSIDEQPSNLSNCEGYGELKKTVGIVKKANLSTYHILYKYNRLSLFYDILIDI